MELRNFILMSWIVSVRCGQRLIGFNFQTVNQIGKKQCLKLCYEHTDCQSVNYSKTRLLCELNFQKETEIAEVTDNSEDFIYITRESISQEITCISSTGACSSVTCSQGKRCIALTSGKTTCISIPRCFGEPTPVRYGYSASLPSDMLTNGTFQSKSFVYAGDKTNYTCAVGTIPVGGNQVACVTNGQWEKPTFSCQVCTATSDPRGLQYRGTKNVTENGRTCQRWETNSPHNHVFHHNEENFCRNPDNDTRPWCYTTNPSVRFEICDISVCA